MLVHPTVLVEIFRNILLHFVPQPFADLKANFYENHPRESLRWGLKATGISKYSDVGHVEGYISQTVQDTASGTITD